MITTVIQQDFFLNALKQEPKILYSEIVNINFSLKDQILILYVEKGYRESYLDELTQESKTKSVAISNERLILKENVLKQMIEATGTDFNAIEENKNLLITEAIRIADKILMNEVTKDKDKFFGKQVELWKIA